MVTHNLFKRLILLELINIYEDFFVCSLAALWDFHLLSENSLENHTEKHVTTAAAALDFIPSLTILTRL